jgi:hypothetical protein
MSDYKFMTLTEAPLNGSENGSEKDRTGQFSESTSATAVDPGRIDQLTWQVASLQKESRSIGQLRRQVRWLVGGLIASVIVLGGSLLATTLNLQTLQEEQAALRTDQADLADQFAALEPDRPSDEQFRQLEQQLQMLNNRAQSISEQAALLFESLPEEWPDVSISQLNDLQQRLQMLEQETRGNSSEDAIATQLNDFSELLRQYLEELREGERLGDRLSQLNLWGAEPPTPSTETPASGTTPQ